MHHEEASFSQPSTTFCFIVKNFVLADFVRSPSTSCRLVRSLRRSRSQNNHSGQGLEGYFRLFYSLSRGGSGGRLSRREESNVPNWLSWFLLLGMGYLNMAKLIRLCLLDNRAQKQLNAYHFFC